MVNAPLVYFSLVCGAARWCRSARARARLDRIRRSASASTTLVVAVPDALLAAFFDPPERGLVPSILGTNAIGVAIAVGARRLVGPVAVIVVVVAAVDSNVLAAIGLAAHAHGAAHPLLTANLGASVRPDSSGANVVVLIIVVVVVTMTAAGPEVPLVELLLLLEGVPEGPFAMADAFGAMPSRLIQGLKRVDVGELVLDQLALGKAKDDYRQQRCKEERFGGSRVSCRLHEGSPCEASRTSGLERSAP